ncbi:MAG: coproporphyrinogen dehydrogenase HemZ [Alicyclobacillus sp.]|nr:coproporphyrinogen dehydrogenase HemZ [Alicyclobacillus sp.]
MHVQVTMDGFSYPREVTEMVQLFWEGARVSLHSPDSPTTEDAPVEPGGLHATVCLRRTSDSVSAHGTLVRGASDGQPQDEVLSANHSVRTPADADETTLRRLGKRVVTHVLHQLFRTYSGAGQPWGILTGIRPLKVAHRWLEEWEKAQPGAATGRALTQSERLELQRYLQEAYEVRADRAELMARIAQVEREIVPDLYHLDREVSVYVGIPFCPTHCAYCTFPAYSMVDKAHYVDGFLQAMERELQHLGTFLREHNLPVTTVYLGGGTPTSLRAAELDRLLDTMFREIPNPGAWREFTVEAGRPDTITPDRVQVMKRYGVDRISVNPQTFKASTLREIRRGHTPDMVDRRFHHVRSAGFDNINMDLIIGLPGETIDDVRYTLERLERLHPESVTVHTLALKRSAVVKTERDQFVIAESPEIRQMVEEAHAWAAAQGYRPYYAYRQRDILGNMENVGFAEPGKEGIYNVCIMEERQTIVGIGGGAVTKLIGPGGKIYGRVPNPREPKAYIETIDQVIARKDKALRDAFGYAPVPR